MFPKIIELLPKKDNSNPKISVSSPELRHSLKNTQLLPKYTTFSPKIPNSCGKEPSSNKNIPIIATQRDTNLATKYPFLPQNSKMLSKNTQIVSKITKFYQIFI